MILDQLIPAVLVGIFGLIMGSFVSALTHRLKTKTDFVKDRSRCVHCDHVLGFFDLVPLFSYLSLAGKCRYCHKKISWQYPLIELSTSLLMVVSYLVVSPQSISEWVLFAVWLIEIVIGMSLAIYDLRWMILPTKLVYLLFLVGLCRVILSSQIVSSEIIPQAVFGVIFYYGIFMSIYLVSKGKWIGGGDVRLAVYLGLSGLLNSFLGLFMASLLGSMVGFGVISVTKNKKAKIPFGPFLLLGNFLAVLFGELIFKTYLSLF